jgi:predicted ArsR family transcriptional regulator
MFTQDSIERSNYIRQRIIELCNIDVLTIKQIAHEIGIRPSTVNHHLLALLKGKYIVKVERDANGINTTSNMYQTIRAEAYERTNLKPLTELPQAPIKLDLDANLMKMMGYTNIKPAIGRVYRNFSRND